MGISSLILIVAALLIAILVIWILRSRNSQAGHHVDSSVTAVGAASEAARNIAEEVTQTIEDSMDADVAASGAKPGDVQAAMSNSAAIMASGGALTFTDIGVPAAVGAPDNLRVIKGLGPKLNTVLNDLGITRYDQIAAWGDDEIARVDAHLGAFKGRITRDNWIEQAKYLASGDTAGFEARFGKLDKPGQA